MNIFLNSLNEITPLNYKVFKPVHNLEQVVHNNKTYKVIGEYSLQTRGKEYWLLVIKAVAVVIFSVGLALLFAHVRANLTGKRIDVIHLHYPPKTKKTLLAYRKLDERLTASFKKPGPVIAQASYQPKKGEDLYKFRANVFQETLKACRDGYRVSKSQEIIKIDTQPMLEQTETYDQVDPLPPLEAGKKHKTHFCVTPEDTLQVLLKYKNPAGINMANLYTSGGGALEGCPAQEEAVCRCSSHYLGLLTQTDNYPLPEWGGVYCPHVHIIRHSDFSFMPNPPEVALVAVAAYDLRSNSRDRQGLGLSANGPISESDLLGCGAYMQGTEDKICNMLRTMAHQKHTRIVLGALGCGAFHNPPQIVAGIFKKVLGAPEFEGYFESVDFAILKIFKNDQANVDAFTGICEELNS